jgi:hypothetical protein
VRIPRPFVKYVLGSASKACSTFNGAFSKLALFISHAVSLHRAGSISRYAKLGKQTAAPPNICVPFAEVLPPNFVSPPINTIVTKTSKPTIPTPQASIL